MPRLPARLCAEPRILFVGINPSLTSGAVGHHFAGPGNPFWRLLHAARLVPEPLTARDDARLPEFQLALTNIVDRATRSAAELTAEDYARGRKRLARVIAEAQPRVVAFVGNTVYRQFFGPRASGGCGVKPERLGDARVFVVPNPSGLNAAYPGFRDKLVWYRRLRRFAEGVCGMPGAPVSDLDSPTPPARAPASRGDSGVGVGRGPGSGATRQRRLSANDSLGSGHPPVAE